ncbi:hypothetical protein C8F04DRAFT_1259453 [Mycena alexandri]|uniref:Uncharacterized protein n=1 Tax=Mycena alexandri TaxID=1745969 RepID=A0AAD6X7L3_9AGAR|nr:hypothetical protein C8F04DRAFT_1259453 [Mycena alexandri]
MPFSSVFHRDGLLRTKEYVPSSMFSASVDWDRTAKQDTLIKVMPGPPNPDGPANPDAILITIGIVSDSNTLKLGPVGNWSTYTNDDWKKKEFSAAKYTFTIVKPKNDPVFAPDFPIAIAALKKVQNTISKTHINKWFIMQDGTEDTIRFAFNVFEKKDKSNSDTDIDIRSWPVPSECRDALEKITDTHVIRPFIVFDVDGTPIEPTEISSKLKALIQQVVILRAAQIKPPSPFKSTAKPYRPVSLRPEEVHAEEQRALKAFALPISAPGPSALPISTPGPSNLPAPPKRQASQEPEGSDPKRANTGETPAKEQEGPQKD